MKIGILGGTFDPPHIGHLVIANQALEQLKLDEVWFMPVGTPTHKDPNCVSTTEDRVALVQLAIRDHPGFRLCLLDAERPGPHYSTTALELLHARHPGNAWYFIMGADSLVDLPKWHEPQRFIELAFLAVAYRPGSQPELTEIEKAVPGVSRRVEWLCTPLLDLASRDLRQRACDGLSLRYLVPPGVEGYIKAHRLYE
jgi:nicotinate-nucleotide adenylyltransferase